MRKSLNWKMSCYFCCLMNFTGYIQKHRQENKYCILMKKKLQTEQGLIKSKTLYI